MTLEKTLFKVKLPLKVKQRLRSEPKNDKFYKCFPKNGKTGSVTGYPKG